MAEDIELTIDLDAKKAVSTIQKELTSAISSAVQEGQRLLDNVKLQTLPGISGNLPPIYSSTRTTLQPPRTSIIPYSGGMPERTRMFWGINEDYERITGFRNVSSSVKFYSNWKAAATTVKPLSIGASEVFSAHFGAPEPYNPDYSTPFTIPDPPRRRRGDKSAIKNVTEFNDALRSTLFNLNHIYRALKDIAAKPWKIATQLADFSSSQPLITTLGVTTADRAYSSLVKNISGYDMLGAAASWQKAKGTFKLKGTGLDLLGEAFVGQFRNAMAESNPLISSWQLTQLAYDYLGDPNTDKDKLRAGFNMIPGGSTFLNIADKARTLGLSDVYSFTAGKYNSTQNAEWQAHGEKVGAAFWPTRKNWQDLWTDIAATFTEYFTMPVADYLFELISALYPSGRDTLEYMVDQRTGKYGWKESKAVKENLTDKWRAFRDTDYLSTILPEDRYNLLQETAGTRSYMSKANTLSPVLLRNPLSPQGKVYQQEVIALAKQYNEKFPNAQVSLEDVVKYYAEFPGLAAVYSSGGKLSYAQKQLPESFRDFVAYYSPHNKYKNLGEYYDSLFGKAANRKKIIDLIAAGSFTKKGNRVLLSYGDEDVTEKDIVDTLSADEQSSFTLSTVAGRQKQWEILKGTATLLNDTATNTLLQGGVKKVQDMGLEGFMYDNVINGVEQIILDAVLSYGSGNTALGDALLQVVKDAQKSAADTLHIEVTDDLGILKKVYFENADGSRSDVGPAASAARNNPYSGSTDAFRKKE